MQITDVTVRPVSHSIDSSDQFESDLGTRIKNDSTIISVTTEEGVTGVGTSLGNPKVIEAIVEHQLAPAIVGEDPTMIRRLWERMYSATRSESALEGGISQPRTDRRGSTLEAISGIDIALWDIKGKLFDSPIYNVLGGSRESIRAYASGGWADEDSIGKEVSEYAARGFSAVKMRVDGEGAFSIPKAIDRIAAAREALGWETELYVDAHGSLDVPTAIRLAQRMEEYDIGWFEEPVSPDNHAGMAEVKGATNVPIAAGEREFTRFEFADLLRADAIDIAQPDVARVGGITEMMRIASMTSAEGVKLAPHAWGNGVLYAASLQVSMAAMNASTMEVAQRDMPLLYDLFEEEYDIRDGRVHAPKGPGLGYSIRDETLDSFEYIQGPEYQ